MSRATQALRIVDEMTRRYNRVLRAATWLSVAVVLLVTALAVVAHRSRGVIVIAPTCGQTAAINNGPNYEARKVRYRWRHV